ncbi:MULTISPECIES: ABC transporter permease [unclassified Gemella]|uniref:ABC transporter permease n=1 Tax=unclassified Gemella TaxID=2624949 RepID=UPI0015D05271|nr:MULTISPECIES: ABC transporter permease [unclassified Gemella]MBF0710683.1 ABC transporter permease [Gemella sp. GL1.1]NYS28027.1 ABC transporter permease [Gemella sp. GL1]
MTSFKTMVKSFFLMEARNKQSLIMGTIFPIVMLIFMGIAGKGESRGDMSYMAYILPGILGMFYASIGLIAFPIMLSSYRENGFLKFLKVTPMKISKVISALMTTQVVIMAIQTFLLLVVCNLLLKLGLKFHWQHTIWLTIILLLSSLALILIGLNISILVKNVKNTSTFGNLANLIFTFLGGAFFPTDVWPKFLQPIVALNPITHMVAMLRSTLLFDDFTVANGFKYARFLILVICLTFFTAYKKFSYEM